MLHEADPTTGEADPPDMPRLEQQVQNFPPCRGVFARNPGDIHIHTPGSSWSSIQCATHQVAAMGPLIDAELERTDRRHAQLTRLSHELVGLHFLSVNASFFPVKLEQISFLG